MVMTLHVSVLVTGDNDIAMRVTGGDDIACVSASDR